METDFKICGSFNVAAIINASVYREERTATSIADRGSPIRNESLIIFVGVDIQMSEPVPTKYPAENNREISIFAVQLTIIRTLLPSFRFLIWVLL